MDARSDVSKCANPDCKSKFVRLGQGELFVFSVADPRAWGLPSHIKQKVFWLCDGCCTKYNVRIDRRHHLAQVVHKPVTTRRVA
jgi:hypothetical protein